MSAETTRQRLVIAAETKPVLQPFVRMRHDDGRNSWVLLAPERVLTPDEIAIEVLNLCDGERAVHDISGQLAKDYQAPQETIEKDVIDLLQNLADKGYIKDMRTS